MYVLQRRFKNREAARRVRERKSNQLNTLQGQVIVASSSHCYVVASKTDLQTPSAAITYHLPVDCTAIAKAQPDAHRSGALAGVFDL